MGTFIRLSIISALAIAAFAFVAPREAEARHYHYRAPRGFYGAYYRPPRVNYYRPVPRHYYYHPRYAPVYPRVHYRPYGYGRAYGYGGFCY